MRMVFILRLTLKPCMFSYLLEDEVEHEDEAVEVHVVLFAVQVEGAVSGSMAQVLEGAAAEGAAVQRAGEGAGQGAQCVVLPVTPWI